ncbi:signal peptidase II [Pararhodobacter oceanensis]|uniref:Lipoprotein signal peptidase n=1 Tax=Pararhodobacter oceanensis TaxID=2172121 RepID=A0A2T8HR31_9RHOB|nr:signal peptidase II [Pararhodobacter oceanensis]PVH27911.1 signal peptidase II [Pararhodobacter oceanensis]
MRIATITTLIILALDQALKWAVVVGLNLREVMYIEVLPPYLNLTMAWNRGVNFGLFAADSVWLRVALVALALIVTGWVWFWVRREGARPLMQLALGFLAGGALGNAIDRITWGAVADFLNVTCCGWVNPWAFNVADIAIFIGAFGLILASGDKTPRDDRSGLR